MAPSNFKDHEDYFKSTDEAEIRAAEERFEMLVKEGVNTPADSDVDMLKLPDFFDREKFRLGQKLFYDNIFAMMVAKLSGLLTLLAVPSILEVLMFTNQSGTACKAFRRYIATSFHAFVWYRTDPAEETEFFKSLHNVRKKHVMASRRCREKGIQRISQRDMALTQFGFVGFTILNNEMLGVATTEEELEGLIHLWRVIGYMLGMEDRYNLCNGSVGECRALCRRIVDAIILPCFATKNKNFDIMGRMLLEGLWTMVPFIDHKAFTAFTLHLAVSSSTNNNHSVVIDTDALPLYSKFLFNLQLITHRYLLPPSSWWSKYVRRFLNSLMRLSIYLTEHCPYLAYWRYGRNNSHVNIYKLYYD